VKEEATPKWTMPKWMEPYRDLITNTGGSSIEELMNGNADPCFCLPVHWQVGMLYRAKNAGLLRNGRKVPA
jgi:hypothetical protein